MKKATKERNEHTSPAVLKKARLMLTELEYAMKDGCIGFHIGDTIFPLTHLQSCLQSLITQAKDRK